MIDSVPPFFSATGMTAVSAGAPTRARNQRGASDSVFASLRIEEASDGSPIACAHVPQMLQTGDEVLDHLRFGRLGRKRKRGRDEILGQPHRALRFGARSPARLPNVVDRVDHEPEGEQRREDEIEPIAQGD